MSSEVKPATKRRLDVLPKWTTVLAVVAWLFTALEQMIDDDGGP